jgi:hypothetical protein
VVAIVVVVTVVVVGARRRSTSIGGGAFSKPSYFCSRNFVSADKSQLALSAETKLHTQKCNTCRDIEIQSCGIRSCTMVQYTSSHAWSRCMRGRRSQPGDHISSLVTYQCLRICTDSILKYHTKSSDVSTSRRHGDTPKNNLGLWYVCT